MNLVHSDCVALSFFFFHPLYPTHPLTSPHFLLRLFAVHILYFCNSHTPHSTLLYSFIMAALVQQKKVVVIGDGAAGKTCLGITLNEGNFPAEYVPTAFDQMTIQAPKDGVDYAFNLWDTAGGEDYDRLRPLSYPQTDLFVILYSIANPASYDNITSKWVPEITHHMPGTPWVLIGSKADLRDDQELLARLNDRFQRGAMTTEEGELLASHHGASGFVEVSALTGYGLRECVAAWLHAVTAPAPKLRKRKPARPQNNVERNVLCTLL